MVEKSADESAEKATGKTTTASDAGDTTSDDGATERRRRGPQMKMDVKAIRTTVARILWAVCLVFAFVLAASVLLIAIEANRTNDLVDFLYKFADKVDLGFFDLMSPVKDFDKKTGPGMDTKTALFNYGIAAIVWLVIGRIADRIVRP